MSFLKIGLATIAVIALSGIPVLAADLETQVVDKNCWIEIFEDDNFDMDDPHVKLQEQRHRKCHCGVQCES